jgi:hypothetical protein
VPWLIYDVLAHLMIGCLIMIHPAAAHGPALFPDNGFSPSHGAGRHGGRMVIGRPRAPGLSSYLTTALIAAGLVAAWAGICSI